MLRESNATVSSGSRHSAQKLEIAPRATCLLCRVLWPRVLPHRHLLIEASSEAKTLCGQGSLSR